MASFEQLFQRVKVHRARFCWYRELTASATRFDELPLLTQELLDEHYYSRRIPAGLTVFTTSGTSSGLRRQIGYSAEEMHFNDQQKIGLFSSFIGNASRVSVVVGLGLAASSARSVFEASGCHVSVLPHDAGLTSIYAALYEERPQVIYSMPSLLSSILDNGPADLPLRGCKVILVGEILTPALRQRFAHALEIAPSDILNTYGCVEMGLVAHECMHCGQFHLMYNIGAEVIPPGESNPALARLEGDGLLVLSSTWRENFPALRFVTYDQVRNLGVTECDGTLIPSFSAVLGRIGHEYKHGERISYYDIENALLTICEDAKFNLIAQNNCLRVEILDRGNARTRIRELEYAVNHANPAIGMMIDNGLLNRIPIVLVDRLRLTDPNCKKRILQ